MSDRHQPYEERTRVFVVRIDLPRRPGDPREWTGSVVDVGSGDRVPLRSPADLMAFIAAHLKATAPGDDPETV